MKAHKAKIKGNEAPKAKNRKMELGLALLNSLCGTLGKRTVFGNLWVGTPEASHQKAKIKGMKAQKATMKGNESPKGQNKGNEGPKGKNETNEDPKGQNEGKGRPVTPRGCVTPLALKYTFEI